jgi:uncharacterized protein YfaS (alpha-2-macroglobulin family)
MHHAFALLLGIACASSPEDDHSELTKLFAEADVQYQQRKRREAGRLFAQFVDASPKKGLSKLRLRALSSLLSLAAREGSEREMEWAKLLGAEFPVAIQRIDGAARRRFDKLIGNKLAIVPGRLRRYYGKDVRLRLYRPSDAHVRSAVLRIPYSSYLAFRGKDWSDHVRRAATPGSPLRPQEWEVLTTRDGARFGRYSIFLRDMSPGVYALREEVEGVVFYHPFEIRGFEMICIEEGDRIALWVVDAENGEPRVRAEVEVRVDDKESAITGRTDEHGLFVFDRPIGTGRTMIRVDDSIETWMLDGPYAREGEHVEQRVYITTDRPIYRPGQTVHFKAVLRNFSRAGIALPAEEDIRIEVRDPMGRVLWGETRRWNQHGSISGDFRLGDEPPLGDYSVVVHVENEYGDSWWEWVDDDLSFWTRSFMVAAYRKPEMSVTTEVVGDLVAGARVRARVTASYFFGGPVVSADVRWRLTRPSMELIIDGDDDEALYRPPLDDPRDWLYRRHHAEEQQFGQYPITYVDEIEYDFEESGWYDGDEESTIAEGAGRTDGDGSLEMDLEVPQDAAGEYEVQVVVRDLSRLTVTCGVGFHVGAPATVHVTSDRRFYLVGETMEAQARVLDAVGEPSAGRDVEFVVFEGRGATRALRRRRDSWPGPESRQVVLRLVQRLPWAGWEFESRLSVTAKTDENGIARARVPVTTAMMVRLLARVRDGAGAEWDDRTHLRWAKVDAGEPIARGSRDDDHSRDFDLEIVSDRVIYEAGEKARFLVRTTRAPISALLTVGGGRLHAARVVRLERREQVIELPLNSAHEPNVVVHLLSLRDANPVRRGQEIYVYPRRQELTVTVEADRETYAPGQTATVSVTTTLGEKGVSSEVELSIVDASVLSLAEDPEDDEPMLSFFVQEGISPYVMHDTCVRLDEMRRDLSDIYGAPPVATPISFFEEFVEDEDTGGADSPVARSKFPDTLLWLAHVRTDENGRAEIEVEMQDSLTEWRVLARAISGAERFGSGSSEVLSRKDVVMRLSAPRFLTTRDEVTIATIVHNHQDSDATFEVSLSGDGAKIEPTSGADSPQTVKVGAGKSRRVDWRVSEAAVGHLKLVASAISKSGSDAVEITLPVRDTYVEQVVSVAGVVREKTWTSSLKLPAGALSGSGTLELTAGDSQTEVVRDAIAFLAGYPYGCVEQTMSRFLPAVVAMRAMKRAGIENPHLESALPGMIDQGLQRLYGFQHDDGGWGWWKDDETDERMTAYVLFGLTTAREAGVTVDELAWKQGFETMRDQTPSPLSVWVSAVVGVPFEREEHPAPASAEDVAMLVLAGREDLVQDLAAPKAGEFGPSSVRSLALVLKAMGLLDAGDPRIPGIVERLLAARRGPKWYSTLDTAWAVFALSDLVRKPGEQRPEWRVRIGEHVHEAKNGRVSISLPDLEAGALAQATLERTSANIEKPLFASAMLRYRISGESLQRTNKQLRVTRVVERARPTKKGIRWEKVRSGDVVRIGDDLRVVLELSTQTEAEHVLVECPIPAGCEATRYLMSDRDYDEGREFNEEVARLELRDDRVAAAFEWIDRGDPHEIAFKIRPTHPGEFFVLPARAFPMYDPDHDGWTEGMRLLVTD